MKKNEPVKTGRPRNMKYEDITRSVKAAIMKKQEGSLQFDLPRSELQGLRVSTSLRELKKEFHGYRIVLNAGVNGGVFVGWCPLSELEKLGK